MQWANWMSLGIIVTHFTCMAQRLVSSMRPTKYVSAASCRHMMALPWKHKSYLPTSWAISQTSCEKGSFLIRISVLFWKCQISWRATVQPVLPGLLYLTSLEEFLLGGFAFHGRLELPPDWLLPQNRWPSLCSYLGQLSGWQWWWEPSHILQPSCLLYLPLSLLQLLLLLPCRWGLSGWGWVVYGWRWPPPLLHQLPPLLSWAEHPPLPLSFLLQCYLHSCHSMKWTNRC